jgi:hypothetical protein
MATQQISPDEPWFAVKCLFSHPSRASDAEKALYEERNRPAGTPRGFILSG